VEILFGPLKATDSWGILYEHGRPEAYGSPEWQPLICAERGAVVSWRWFDAMRNRRRGDSIIPFENTVE
jgi:hypothetical protein